MRTSQHHACGFTACCKCMVQETRDQRVSELSCPLTQELTLLQVTELRAAPREKAGAGGADLLDLQVICKADANFHLPNQTKGSATLCIFGQSRISLMQQEPEREEVSQLCPKGVTEGVWSHSQLHPVTADVETLSCSKAFQTPRGSTQNSCLDASILGQEKPESPAEPKPKVTTSLNQTNCPHSASFCY